MYKMKIDSVSNKDQLENKLPNVTSCFVAGTLVHTDQGLVPIEQLQVGDMVLSMSEEGVGQKAYKRVVKTFKSKQKEPIMSPVSDIYCTDNHPFWTKDNGWVAAKLLDINTHRIYALGMDHTGYYDYPQYYLTNVKGYYRDLYEIGGLYLLPTSIDGVAVCLETNDYNIRSENQASLIDFRNSQQKYICSTNGFSDLYALSPDKYNQVAKSIYSRVLYEAIEGEGINEPFYDFVYNIEVEEYHTYFVGEYGYWVHDLWT